jgi:protease-4
MIAPRLAAALVLVAGACAPAVRAAPTPAQPLLVWGNESAAYAEGSRSVFYNPACLGLRYPADLFASWTQPASGPDIYRLALGVGGFGLQAERVPGAAQRYGFTTAAGSERLRWGLANDWLVDEATHEVRSDQRAGLISRMTPWLSLGAVVDHVFAPVLRGSALPRTYTLAAGVRPLALDPARAHGWGTRLTLTSDLILPERGAARQTRVRVGGEFEALPGLLIRGSIEDRGGVHLGLTLHGATASYGGESAIARGRRRYECEAISLHSGEERTLLTSRPEQRVAEVRVGGDLGDDALAGVSLFGGTEVTPVKPLHDQLERALEDPLTRGVFLDLRGVENMAQIEELRPRIARLRAAGKPVVAFLEYGGGRADFYLASACDRVVITPEAEPVPLGLHAERRFYRRVLESWGIRVDRSSWGKYKSAYRSFSVDSTPPADRESIERGLDVSQDLFVSALAADRHRDRDEIARVLDGRPWRASDLQSAGLVDSVGYREDAKRILGRLCGLGDKPRAVALLKHPAARREWTVPAPVAVVYASGAIITGKSGGDLLMGPAMGSETVAAQIEQAFRRRDVKAVVLRVESPGGSVLASDLILHAAERLKRETKKPLIVSMGSVAASGGYYISMGADLIFADRQTRTGSIGVFLIKPSLEGWYAKHGVRQESFDRGAWMRGWSTNWDWTPEDQAIADSATQRFYHAFVERVAAGRGMSWDGVDAVAQGRVWWGDDARERGLVDRIGGLEDAIAEARRRARIPEAEKTEPLEYRRPRPGLLRQLVTRTVSDAWREATRTSAPGSMLYWDEDDETSP